MKITYKLTEEELYAYNLFRSTRKNAGTVSTALMIAFACLAMMLMLGYIFHCSFYVYFIFLAMAAAVFGFIILFLRHRMKRSVKILMYRQRKEESMPQTTITLEDDYFEVYTVSRTSEINYSSVERLEKSKEFLYLELDQNGEVGIPLRAFESSQERDTFLRMFIEKTPKAVHAGVGYLVKPQGKK
jgi:hypothetical protein